jgi:PAS domain S-box-containing protein
MDIKLKGAKLAIIGGTSPCREILELLTGPELSSLECKVVLVADTLDKVGGMEYAREIGVPTTNNYDDVCHIDNLDVILKLKSDVQLSCTIDKIHAGNARLIDLDAYRAMSFINLLKLEQEKLKIKEKIKNENVDTQTVEELFDHFSEKMRKISEEENNFLVVEREGLIEMEKELSQIIQGSMIPTFIINNEHIITHWNTAVEELTGHNAYELVGTDRQWVPFRSAKRPTMADVIVGQMSEEEVEKFYGSSWRKSSLINEAYEAEEFFPHLGENGKWIFFTAAPIKSPDGKIIGAIETLKDISKEKKGQQEILLQDKELSKLYEKYKNSEEKYRSLFNDNPTPIFIIDHQTLEILDINNRVETVYGFKKSQLLGSPFLDICDETDDTIKEGFDSLVQGKSILFTKKKHYKADHTTFFVNIIIVDATYSNRDVMIASVTDITESVEKETQLIQAGKLATLGTMAAGMAHEINQPLNVIQICADLMLKMMKKGMTIPEEELTTIATDIIDNVARAAAVIRHVRDFSRQSERDLKRLCINDPINDVFKVLGHQVKVHSIDVYLDLDPEIPDVRAEHNRLEQVFINLVSNAIDAMDEKAENADGQVEKKLTIKTALHNGNVLVQVADTGTGMTPEIKRKIFEPFFTTKETGKGTGLGTSISFGIIKDYGGTIDIHSEYGQGTTFNITFPAIE